MEATIIIATHGSDEWRERGNNLAIKTNDAFPGVEIVFGHSKTEQLHEVRNRLAARATSEWLCFLDADDELAPGYFDAMERATGDLRAPAVSWVEEGISSEPRCLTERNIKVGNPCVIGTLIRKSMFDRVGGFWGERAYEDWSLFRRAWLVKAKIEHVPDALYIVHVSPDSRNNTVDDAAGLCEEIRISHREWMRQKKR